MKIKLDEMLPAALVEILSSLGHDVETVPMEELSMGEAQFMGGSHDKGPFMVVAEMNW